jgi:Mn-containing catalase
MESGFYCIQLCEIAVHEVSHLEILALVVYIYLVSGMIKEKNMLFHLSAIRNGL